MKRNNPLIKYLVLLLIFSALPAYPGVHAENPSIQGIKPPTIVKNKTDYEFISFEQLAFNYQPPIDVENPDGTVTKASKKHMAIPPAIKVLNGKKVAIKGFIIPMGNSDGNVQTFLFADQFVTCLFCAMLSYDEWMVGTVVNPQGFHIKDDQYEEPITIYGTLEVGEKYEEGQFAGIYRIKADSFETERKKILGIL